MKVLYLGGKTAGLIGLLTLLSRGMRPDVVAYSEDIFDLAHHHELKFFSFGQLQYLGPWDLLVSVHCRNIIPKAFLDSLPLGGLNLHPCLNAGQGYKGASPVRRALENGETVFSVAAHKMTPQVDGGPVVVERFITIPRSDELVYTEKEIYAALYPLYSIVLSEALDQLLSSRT